MKRSLEAKKANLIDRLGCHPTSVTGRVISDLSEKKLDRLLKVVDLDTDCLIDIDEESFSVNHGNVGSGGIDYYFD